MEYWIEIDPYGKSGGGGFEAIARGLPDHPALCKMALTEDDARRALRQAVQEQHPGAREVPAPTAE